MNKKIKLFSASFIVLAGLFLGADFAVAQSTTVTSCTSATLNGVITDTSGVAVSTWFEWGTNFNTVDTGAGTRTATQIFSTPQNVSQILTGLNPNTTYYYRGVASNSYGTTQGGTLSFTTPSCAVQNYNNNNYNYNYTQQYVSTNSASSITQNSAVLNGYVTSGGTNMNAWFEWGTSYSLGNTTSVLNYGTGATSFNNQIFNLNPNTTYYYRAAAQSLYGTVYGNTLSFTTTGQPYNYNYNYNYSYNTYTGSAPTVTTLLATDLTNTTAKLNGLVFSSDNQSSTAYFEWGANGSLGSKTQTMSVGALPVVKHSDYITGLVKGQTYYYRIVAENTYGKVYGSVNTFVAEASTYVATPAPVVSTPVVLRPTTTAVTRGSSAQSLVTLSIEGGAEMIGSGEKRTYRVQWKNDSAQSLKDVVLRVTFPKNMNVDSATKGAFSATDNSVIVDLKTLPSKESGDTFIFATTGRGLKAGEVLVVTANMVYTGTNGVQGDAVAYIMHRAEMAQNGNGIGANIFGAGEFVPTTVFEWVLLMILTLVLVLLGNHLYGRFSDERR